MSFFVQIEKVLQKRRIPFKYALMICIFCFFALFATIMSIIEGNFFAVIAIFISALMCFSFSREIKKLYAHSASIEFQKELTTQGFDCSMFAFFIFSENGKCIFVNNAAQNLFSGFRIRTIEDLALCFGKYPKIVEAIRNLQVAVTNQKASHIDVPMTGQTDGASLWRIAAASLQGNKEYSAWTIMDLTPSLNRINSLDTDSNFLLSVINNSSAGYFALNDQNEITFCNKIFAHWLGSSITDVVGKNFYELVNNKADKLPIHKNTENNLNFMESIVAKITLKSGLNETVDVFVRQIPIDNNEITSYLVTRESQQSGDLVQALGKTKLYFEYIFEDAPVGILVTAGAEIIHAYNRTFKNISGIDKVENISFLDIVSDEERETVHDKLYQLLNSVYQSIDPFEIQFKSQTHKTVMVYVSKIEENPNIKEEGLILYFIDITERKELQNQFVQSQKMQAVGQLAGGIAHDFNNLLTAMIGYCDLLLEKYIPSDQAFNDVMQIKQNANRASNLVRQLLAFSRQQTLQPKTLSVTDMISELFNLLKRLLGEKVELKVTHGRDLGFVKVDQIQFEQIIINLAVNARDAMKNGGTLSIETSAYHSKESKILREDVMPPGDYVLIEVKDNGTGIPEKYMHRIFDPFFSTKEKGRGTGLGLSTVYGIVNQTGGFISVESELNVGTKFSIYFPMVTEVEEETITRDNRKDKKVVDLTGVGTILLVEDEDAVRMFSTRALRDKGYRVIEASNGESALEYISKEKDNIDLVITDVVMPKMDGPTLMKHIRAQSAKMKVIFISGYTEDNLHEAIANDSKVYFLPKPFNLKELAHKVKEVIG